MRLVAGLMLLTTFGCGAPQATQPPAKLFLSTRGGPHAVALVTVAGLELPFWIDTGADENLLSSSLAWYLQLPRSQTDGWLVDHTGAEMPMIAVDARIAVPGFGPTRFFAVHLPSLDAIGVAGLLSPQALIQNDRSMVVVDLVHGVLAPHRRHAAAPSWTAKRCTNGRGYVVDASVAGQPARLLIDTGSPRTQVYADSAAARAVEGQVVVGGTGDLEADLRASTAAGVIGTTEVKRFPGIAVRAGTTTRTVELAVSGKADHDCHNDGLLGLDVLGACSLELTRDEMRGHCGAAGRTLPPSPPRRALPPVVFTGTDVIGSCEGAMVPPAPPARALRYDHPLAAWAPVTAQVHQIAFAHASACTQAGYAQANATVDLRLDAARATVRGTVTIVPGRRFRIGVVRLMMQDGTAAPALPITELRERDWYDPRRVAQQEQQLRPILEASGLLLSTTNVSINEVVGTVDIEFRVGTASR